MKSFDFTTDATAGPELCVDDVRGVSGVLVERIIFDEPITVKVGERMRVEYKEGEKPKVTILK